MKTTLKEILLNLFNEGIDFEKTSYLRREPREEYFEKIYPNFEKYLFELYPQIDIFYKGDKVGLYSNDKIGTVVAIEDDTYLIDLENQNYPIWLYRCDLYRI